MSLFHCSEWYNTIILGATSMALDRLIKNRDQLVVGSLEGTLTVIDPGGNIEQRHELAVIVECDLQEAILQVCIGKFLSSFDNSLIVALHPRSLVYFRLVQKDEESYLLDRVFEHKLNGDAGFNMCKGFFGGSYIEQLCVQSISSTLTIFEGENCVLTRQLSDSIHPGPLAYTSFSESILLTSGGHLTSVRYNVLTSNTSLHQSTVALGKDGLPIGKSTNKKLIVDWSLNLGDTPLELCVIGTIPIQPSIVVLCKRAVFCITHGGSIRYVIRLQCVATSIMINNSSKKAEIQICVGVSTQTLIFFSDTKMIWSAQLSFVPIFVSISSFGESLRCLLSMISDNGRIFIGYLGTEPSLFRMPNTETRHIDLEARKKQLQEYETIIWKSTREENLHANCKNSLQVTVEMKMDQKSMSDDVNSYKIPSATAYFTISGIKDKVDVIIQSEIFANQTNFSLTSTEIRSIPITLFCKKIPVLDLRCQIAVISNTVEVVMKEFLLPLQLVCYETTPQKAALFKISLDSSDACLDISQLFPEFLHDFRTSLGVQPYFSDTIVSIFVSDKMNRYRIQSNSTSFLFVVFSELIRRVKERQPNANLKCPIPFNIFLSAISDHLETEAKRNFVEKNISRLAVQMRHAETVLLNKLKSDREPFTSHLSALINYTYQEIISALDESSKLDAQLDANGRRPFKALLDLFHSIVSISSTTQLPFDGKILNGCDQKLGDVMAKLFDTNSFTKGVITKSLNEEGLFEEKSINALKVNQIIVDFCEKNVTSTNWPLNIAELPEENENEDSEKEKAINSAVNEFLELKSGSLPSQFGNALEKK